MRQQCRRTCGFCWRIRQIGTERPPEITVSIIDKALCTFAWILCVTWKLRSKRQFETKTETNNAVCSQKEQRREEPVIPRIKHSLETSKYSQNSQSIKVSILVAAIVYLINEQTTNLDKIYQNEECVSLSCLCSLACQSDERLRRDGFFILSTLLEIISCNRLHPYHHD